MDMSVSKPQEIVKDREAWWAAGHGVTKSGLDMTEWLNNNIKYGDEIIILVYPTRLLILVEGSFK